MADKTLILVDGSSFLYRAYHVSRDHFTTRSGVPTGVSLILTRMLRGLVKKFAGAPMVAVFDARGKSFRSELYRDYKANRPPMPEDLRVQLDYVSRIVRALGLPLVSVPGVEADDVLGSYARRAGLLGYKTVICTGDKDLAQLVDGSVTLYDSMSGRFCDRAGVIEKYGVPPELIVDLLALKGDASDNIPGMKGCGEKTALALLNGIGGVEEIAGRLEDIAALDFRGAGNFAPRFQAALGDIRLSYRLATIRTDVDLDPDVSEVKPPVPDYPALLGVFEELEFHKLTAELKQEMNASAAVLPAGAGHADYKGSRFHTVLSEEDLRSLVQKIRERGLAALDTETTSLKPDQARLVGVSFAVDSYEGYYLPLGHSSPGAPAQIPLERAREVLGGLFADPGVKFIGHNLKYDLLVLHFNGFTVPGAGADTMVLAHLINSAQSVSLDALALKYLGYTTITYDAVTLRGRRRLGFEEVEVERAAAYSGEDAEVCLRLYHALYPRIGDNPALRRIYEEIDMPLLHVLYVMEKNGVLLDEGILAERSRALARELAGLREEIFAAAGGRFNISSPKQLSEILFERLAIPYPKKARGGKYSTAEDILRLIAPRYDIANLILRFRELQKLISAYTEKLPQMICRATGRVHTSFNQAGTITGRLSSNDPNLQNIPARTEDGRMIRAAFIARPGYTLLSADYSQIELRLIADISGDEALRNAFRAGQDIHKATAAEVLGKSIDEVTPAERSRAKATNFGLMYGMGAFGLSAQTGMTFDEARDYIAKYFSRYPRVREYMDRTRRFAHEHGYVLTLVGRPIAVDNINSANAAASRGAERAAINAPMQGSAADIIKLAMIAIQKWIESLDGERVFMTVQVHDELLFEIRDDFVSEAAGKIRELMENALRLSVPLTVGVGTASNWGDAH